VQPDPHQQTAGVNSELKRVRFEFARPGGVLDRAIEVARCGKRAAGVAMPGPPSRAAFNQAFIGRRRRFVMPTIAEQPRTKIGCRLMPRAQFKGSAGAVEGVFGAAAVIKCFAQSTIKSGSLMAGKLVLAQLGATRCQIARGDRTFQALSV
jgi:hypothetical protein